MRMTSRFFAIVLLTAALASGLAHAQSSGSISVEGAFSRATPGGAKVGVGYLTIANNGSTADRLLAASSPAAGRVEVHEMAMDGGVMKMRALAGGLPIEPGKTAALKPGGNHLMLIDLKAPLKAGDKVPVTLTFEKAGKIDVTLDVLGIGARQPGSMPMQHDGGAMHKM